MRGRISRAFGAGTIAAALLAVPVVSQADPPVYLGPGDAGVGSINDQAVLKRSVFGYRYIAGQQDSHLTITLVDGDLLYTDTGTLRLASLPGKCAEQPAEVGIAVLCPIPSKYVDSTMFLEVWPRLGDDFVDASTLPASFRLWVLADAGRDEVYGGAGNDFVNGAFGRDIVHAGDGNDWIRTGPGRDTIWGDGGNDRIVGIEGDDRLHGGDGDDSVEGGPGDDQLWGDAGRDRIRCAGGSDSAYTDESDVVRLCEQVAAG